MKNSLKYLSLLWMALYIFACKPEEINIKELTNFPPGILSVTPSDGNKVVKGNFDVKVQFVDGTTSPLASASVSVKDPGGKLLAKVDKALSGTADSIVIKGSTFNAASLPTAEKYSIEIVVTDTKGQTQTIKTLFEISSLPYAAIQKTMWIAGEFNNWGGDELKLVADNTWEVKNIDLKGKEWKLKNCLSWCDKDWGDEDCDGVMSSPSGNSKCSPVGLVNFRWNDKTLQYTITPAVTFKTNISMLYLLGSFNNFQGTNYQLNLVADYTWVMNEALIKPTDKFKFAEGPNFKGKNWGDNEPDGVADEYGNNITFKDLADNKGEAFYKITFNDKTRTYKFDFVKFPSIGIIGSATPGGWDTDTKLKDNGDGTFSGLVKLIDGEAKFRANGSWDTNWGGSAFPKGVGTPNGPNIPVKAGTYNVVFKPATGEYEFKPGISSLGIIGSATPGGWGADTDLTDNGDGTYSGVLGLVDGEAKFRINKAWDTNWGASGFPTGKGTLGGPNIPISAGLYLITFNPGTGDYKFEKTTIGIIGSATPGGWGAETKMNISDPKNPNIATLTLDLGAGEAKFRANNDWKFNWGATGFPSGKGTPGGPNIPIPAGKYTVTFNVNTGEYSFK